MGNEWFIEFVRKDIREYGPELDIVVVYEDKNGEIEDYQIDWFKLSKVDLYFIYGKNTKKMKLIVYSIN